MTIQHDPGRFTPIDRETWLAAVTADLSGKPFSTLSTTVADGVTMSALAEPTGNGAVVTGAIRATLKRTGPWDARQAFRLGPDTAAAVREDVAGGVRSVLLEGDQSTRADDVTAVIDMLPHVARLAVDAGSATPELAEALMNRDVPAALWAAFHIDPLASAGTGQSDLAGKLSEMATVVAHAADVCPQACSVVVDTSRYEHAGADAVQQLAYAVATGVTYLRTLADAGIPVAAAAARMLFVFRAGGAFVVEVAKLRAFRWVWARVLQTCGVDVASVGAQVQVRTSDRVLSQRDPWVNLLRGTLTGFIGAVGTADIVTVAPFDRALGTPDGLARRVARNTHQVLADEAYLAKVIDPAAGSEAVDAMTETLGQAAWGIFQRIEAMGGMVSALTSGWVAEAVSESAQVSARRAASRRDMITGVSAFPVPDEAPLSRDGAGLDAGSEAFPLRRPAAMFEALRDRTDRAVAMTGVRPSIFLAVLGSRASHTARASWVTNLVGVAGVTVTTHTAFDDDAAMAAAFQASGATVAVLCGADATYLARAAGAAAALMSAGAAQVLLAGRPAKQREAWSKAGVDGYLHVGINVRDALDALLTTLEVA